jgi:hypothetical protein
MAKKKLRKGVTAKSKKGRKSGAGRTTRRKLAKPATGPAKKARKKPAKHRRSESSKTRARRKKKVFMREPQIETEIVDVIEEPVPGVVTVTEVETTRLIVPDSTDEDMD